MGPMTLIDGVRVKSLRVIPDERGRLFEILRRDEPDLYTGFGQAYVTTTMPGVVKAWHYHERQEDFFTCVRGMIRLAIYDDRLGSPTRGTVNEFFMGDHDMKLVVVPRRTWHGWKCISEHEAMILNLVSEPYDAASPDEIRRPPHDNGMFVFDWARRDG